ncbi:MAG: hypothetical protein P8O07_10495 [Crocinitomicaceae bacterium]|nr:hypothetical protein [Crocinitomicaceae bacterium]
MKKLIGHLLTLLILFSCAKEQPKVSWLKIESFQLEENLFAQNDQGELSHALTEAFVNMDGQYLGAFQLPIKIPIIGEGQHEIVILPGIINNGISDTKKRYPFVEPYTVSVNLLLEDTISITPITRYYAQTKFLIEDFENAVLKIETDGASQAIIEKENDPAVLQWGNSYGVILLNPTDSLFIGYTNFGQSLPKQGAEVYLEMDYMNTNSMLTSVLSYSSTTFNDDIHIQINPQEEPPVWKHIYLDLKEIVSFRMNANTNEQGFTALLDEAGTSKYIYIDNLKVVYY